MNASPPPVDGTTSPQPPPAPAQDPLNRLFVWLRSCGLYRADERWIGGVCAGLGQRLGVDPLIVRAAFVLLGLVFGAGITLYLLAWVLLPDQQASIVLERAIRGGEASAIGLLVITAVVVTSGFGWLWGIGGGAGLPLVIVLGGLGYLLVRQHQGRSAGTLPGATHTGWHGGASHTGWPHGTGSPAAWQQSGPAPSTSHVGSPAAQPDPAGTEGGGSSAAVVPYTGSSPLGRGAVGATPSAHGSASTPPGSSPSGGSPLPTFTAAPAGTGAEPPSGPPTWSPPPAAAGWTPPTPPPPRPRRRRLGAGLTLILLGVAAVVGAVTTLVTSNTDLSEVAQRLGWTAAAVTVALGVLGAGLAGRRAGLASFAALVLALVAATSAILPRDLDVTGPAGERYWAPTQVTSATAYSLSYGAGELDLRQLAPPTTPTTIRSKVSIGQLRIIAPPDVPVRIVARTDVGPIELQRSPGAPDLPGGTTGVADVGNDVDSGRRTITLGAGTPALTIDARVGIGGIRIERTS